MKKVLAIILMVAAITALFVSCAAEPKHEHSYGTEWKKDATNHWHECSCGEKTDVVAHSWKEKQTKAPTCTEKGLKTITCSVCQETKTEEIDVDPNNHVAGTWEMAEEETFLKPRVEKSTCTKCSAELKRTTDNYKSVTGFWASKLNAGSTEDLPMDMYFYMNIDEATSTCNFDESIGSGFTMEITAEYDWGTKEGTRTSLNMKIEDPSNPFSCEIVAEDIENNTLTLNIIGDGAPVAMEFKRVSEEPHVHKFEEKVTSIVYDDDYDFRKTKCENTSLHPELVIGVEHDYSDESNREKCTICGKTRKYKIRIYDIDGNFRDTSKVTNAEGFIFPDKCYSDKVEYWKNKKTDKTYANGTVIYPTEDMEVIYIKHEHVWVLSDTINAATCTAAGWGAYTCKSCGDTKNDSIAVDKTNHSNTEWRTDRAASLFKPKTEKEYCSGCNSYTGKIRETDEFSPLSGFWVTTPVKGSGAGNEDYPDYYFSFNSENNTYIEDEISKLSHYPDYDKYPNYYYVETKGTYTRSKDAYGNNTIKLTNSEKRNTWYSSMELSERSDGKVQLALYMDSDGIETPAGFYIIERKSEEYHTHTFVDVDKEKYVEKDEECHYHATNCDTSFHDNFDFIGRYHEYQGDSNCSVCGGERYYVVTITEPSSGYYMAGYAEKDQTLKLDETFGVFDSEEREIDYWYELETPNTRIEPGTSITVTKDTNLSFVYK